MESKGANIEADITVIGLQKTAKFEATKHGSISTLVQPAFDEVEKLKNDIEFNTRALKQKKS